MSTGEHSDPLLEQLAIDEKTAGKSEHPCGGMLGGVDGVGGTMGGAGGENGGGGGKGGKGDKGGVASSVPLDVTTGIYIGRTCPHSARPGKM